MQVVLVYYLTWCGSGAVRAAMQLLCTPLYYFW